VAKRDDENAVEQTVRVDASRATVWRCVTRSDLLSKWLEAGVSLDPRKGGAIPSTKGQLGG